MRDKRLKYVDGVHEKQNKGKISSPSDCWNDIQRELFPPGYHVIKQKWDGFCALVCVPPDQTCRLSTWLVSTHQGWPRGPANRRCFICQFLLFIFDPIISFLPSTLFAAHQWTLSAWQSVQVHLDHLHCLLLSFFNTIFSALIGFCVLIFKKGIFNIRIPLKRISYIKENVGTAVDFEGK